jgi:hypothetical protein
MKPIKRCTITILALALNISVAQAQHSDSVNESAKESSAESSSPAELYFGFKPVYMLSCGTNAQGIDIKLCENFKPRVRNVRQAAQGYTIDVPQANQCDGQTVSLNFKDLEAIYLSNLDSQRTVAWLLTRIAAGFDAELILYEERLRKIKSFKAILDTYEVFQKRLQAKPNDETSEQRRHEARIEMANLAALTALVKNSKNVVRSAINEVCSSKNSDWVSESAHVALLMKLADQKTLPKPRSKPNATTARQNPHVRSSVVKKLSI